MKVYFTIANGGNSTDFADRRDALVRTFSITAESGMYSLPDEKSFFEMEKYVPSFQLKVVRRNQNSAFEDWTNPWTDLPIPTNPPTPSQLSDAKSTIWPYLLGAVALGIGIYVGRKKG